MSAIGNHRSRLKVRMERLNRARYGFLMCEVGLHIVKLNRDLAPDLHEIVPRGWMGGIKKQEEHLQEFFNEINCVLVCRDCHEQVHNNEDRKKLLTMKTEQGYDIIQWLDDLPLSDATMGELRRWAHSLLVTSEVTNDESDSSAGDN